MAVKGAWKQTALRVGAELGETGRVVLRAPALVKGAECAIRFLLGGILAGAEVLGAAAPFGLSLVACSGSGTGGLFALLGACFGYLTIRGFTDGLRYAAAAVLIFSVAFAFYDIRAFRRPWFMPLVAALLAGCTGFVYLSAGRWSISVGILFFCELLLTGAGAYFFRVALSPWKARAEDGGATLKQGVSGLILGAAVLIALSRLEFLGGISVGRLCACLAVMLCAHLAGPGVGAAAGISAGLAMDLAAGGPPFYSMAYSFAGLLTGAFWKQGKLFSALTYVLSSALAVLWTWEAGAHLLILYEVFIASVFFMLLPDRLLRRMGTLLTRENEAGAARRTQDYVRARLAATAAAFRTLADSLKSSFRPTPQNDEDSATLFDRAAERVCKSCALRNACWQRDYTATFDALNNALPGLMDRGRGVAGDFPEYFRSRCVRFPAFLAACNEELTALLTRRQYQRRLLESRSAVCRQYGDLADTLNRAATELGDELTPDLRRARTLRHYLAGLDLDGETAVFYNEHGHLTAQLTGRGFGVLQNAPHPLRIAAALGVPLAAPTLENIPGGSRVTFRQAQPLAAAAGISARQKPGETVSGDAGIWFTLEDGMCYVLLCDGMGSGPAAHRESTLATHLLEQFLRAGVTPEAALKTLNSALALRGEAEGGFTTVDLLALDLFQGTGAVYKYGAAPTYLKKGATVTRLSGSSLPAGLLTGEGSSPDVTGFTVSPGDWVVLLSDGVLDTEDGWLRDALRDCGDCSPKELAQLLVAHDSPQAQPDDKTAVVIAITRGSSPT